MQEGKISLLYIDLKDVQESIKVIHITCTCISAHKDIDTYTCTPICTHTHTYMHARLLPGYNKHLNTRCIIKSKYHRSLIYCMLIYFGKVG